MEKGRGSPLTWALCGSELVMHWFHLLSSTECMGSGAGGVWRYQIELPDLSPGPGSWGLAATASRVGNTCKRHAGLLSFILWRDLFD